MGIYDMNLLNCIKKFINNIGINIKLIIFNKDTL